MNIVFVFEGGKWGRGGGMVLRVDEYDFGVVVLEEWVNVGSECVVKRDMFELVGKDQGMEVGFAGVDGEIVFERRGVVGVIGELGWGV